MTSAQGNRADTFHISNSFDKRMSVTAAESRSPPKLFSPEEIQNIKLNHLRQKRRELEEKLKSVSNRLNFRKKKEEEELRKFMRSEEKSLTLMEVHNYKKFNEMLKEELDQRNQFETKRKAKQVEEAKITNQRRLSLIYQSIKDRKLEESEKLRHAKKIDQQNLKYNKEMAHSMRREQYQAVNRMKERQISKKRCFWFEKRMSFQQKMIEEAQIYQKHIENYYKKIQALKDSEEELRQQEAQAQQILKCAQQNFKLLRQS